MMRDGEAGSGSGGPSEGDATGEPSSDEAAGGSSDEAAGGSSDEAAGGSSDEAAGGSSAAKAAGEPSAVEAAGEPSAAKAAGGSSDEAAGGSSAAEAAGRTDEEAVAVAREEVVEGMARAFEVWGVKRSYGRLYGILFFADEPLSLDELVERSGYAKSTVSTATSTLERYHLVRRRSPPGEGKKVFYEAERDFWHVFQQFLTQEVRSEIRIMTRALDSAAETLADADSEQARRDRERVERLRSLYQRSETLVDVLTRASLERVVEAFRRLRSGDGE